MARLARLAPRLLAVILTTALLAPGSAGAERRGSHRPRASRTTHRQRPAHRQVSARRVAPSRLAGPDPVALAAAVAERYWGAAPCGGQVATLPYSTLAPGLDPTTDGWVTFDSSLGPNDLEAPASTYTQCAISLANWRWPTRTAVEEDWNMFCLTMTHEMGHLLGHPHSSVPGSVMAPVFTDESSVPPICRTTRPRGSLP